MDHDEELGHAKATLTLLSDKDIGNSLWMMCEL